jgi:hypothetical protein
VGVAACPSLRRRRDSLPALRGRDALAPSICTVKEKLCEVADRHPGEEEYQGLCRKAELECSEAEDSFVACVESRESREEAVSK